ncbi:MAG: hypothetical protein COV91_05225 [Candidatus Taylorbacteria bacterium CG11_big_fil_rev_8_21_14_0_20_46_11]|uniref:Pilus assembly protein PilO n=1 Tax=Candidatus Taylorbacteria bacterium CG11_big_fil_rev_8_21_14_0_20_46_11 TaxID=1975025 RepID=A0A2H0KAE6_9BACT|nr:MAG: hypothetical protein COV91_05225 [Candidatus Taylorbacteria bacterium CG11_big_fil_rev_8_21_14_0_20_46_11]
MNNLTATILIVASVGLFFGYINPTYGRVTGSTTLTDKSIKELQTTKEEYISALAKAKEVEDARQGLLTVYKSIPPEDLDNLLKLLPDHIDSVRLIIDINNIGSQYGLALQNVALAEQTTGSKVKVASSAIGPRTTNYSSVVLRFAVSGSYSNFRAFLLDLERSLRLIDIDTLSFTSKGEADSYDFSLTVSTYRLE